MTTGEGVAIISLGFTVVVNIAAFVWAAAKMTSKVEQVTASLVKIEKNFSDFMVEHRKLEKLVGTHSTAIALIAQATKIPIRHTDVHEGFGHDTSRD